MLKQFIKYAPGGHSCSRGTYEHDERSRPMESLTRAMFSGVPAVFFVSFFGVVSFFWLLRSDPVARIFLTHLTISSFDGKFMKLYFAWVSLAPFCMILTQFIKWPKNFLFIGIFHSYFEFNQNIVIGTCARFVCCKSPPLCLPSLQAHYWQEILIPPWLIHGSFPTLIIVGLPHINLRIIE